MLTTPKKEIIREFQEYLEIEKGLAPNSIFSYISDIHKLERFLDKNQKEIVTSTNQDVNNFLREETRNQISNRTKARVIASLRQFYNYLENLHVINSNPMIEVESPKIEKHLPDYLTKNEIQLLFSVFDESNILELRDKTMFELLYSSGLRITEACSLSLEELDFHNMVISIKGKGDRDRLVPIGDVAKNLLDRYIGNVRNEILGAYHSHYVFVSKKGSSLNRKSAWRLLKKYIERANMNDKNITPHTFRHSFATHLLQNKADLKSVQELLGHIDISTTQIYTHVANDHLEKTYNEYHPRA